MVRTISRRAILRGAGGTAMALPFLDIMTPRRVAAQVAKPMRYFVGFCGSSIANKVDFYTPKKTGRDFELTVALQALGGRTVDAMKYPWDSLAGETSVVSNLKIPWEPNMPGGRPAVFHSSSPGPLLSGVRSTDSIPDCRGVTSDEVVAAAVAGKQKLRFRSLAYRVQPERYRTSYPGNKGYMSFRNAAAGGIEPNTPIVSPRLAYDQMFSGFKPADEKDATVRLYALEKNRSVLDLVRDNSDRLLRRLGTGDRQRLQRHFDEIRDLETRLVQIPEMMPAMSCQVLPDPGSEPTAVTGLTNTYAADRPVGYTGEDQRARVLSDLVYMAFACDMTRVATLMFTFPMCFMSVEPLIGKKVDLHDLGHGGGNDQNIGEAIGWHIKHVAYLADRLRRTTEGDGNLLDRSALVFVNEGGVGFDPEQNATSSTHSTDSMTALIMGGRAGGLKPGQHVATSKRHPAEVLITAMNAVGVTTDTLGEVKGGVRELMM